MGYLTRSLLCLLLVALTSGKKKKPNILFIMSDDIGNADVQSIDPSMWTPALMALEKRGIVMNQSYTLQTCTPTRTALLTGKYPYKLGFQLGKIKGTILRWLDVHQKLLHTSLQELGYTTHAVGKWHLGFCNVSLLPTRRGFDTFYGFYGGAQGYFNHSGKANGTYDFRDNETVAWDAKGKYSTELFTQRVQDIISRHSESRGSPFFIYLAYQTAHAPFEAKQWYVDKFCANVTDTKRRIHCGMVAAMDDGIGNITKTLEEKGVTKNTLIIYLSHNGGVLGEGSYNWPFRGNKGTFWEGGMRSCTLFVDPARMKRQLVDITWDGLFHVTDWYPILYRAAGGNMSTLQQMDGVNQYKALVKDKKRKRNTMVYNIDPTNNRSAVHIGDFKLFTGNQSCSLVISSWWLPPDKKNATSILVSSWDDTPYKQLFNLREDPTESQNLMDQTETNATLKDVFNELEDLLVNESKNVKPFPDKLVKNPAGKAQNYGGVWSPGWCDPFSEDPTSVERAKELPVPYSCS